MTIDNIVNAVTESAVGKVHLFAPAKVSKVFGGLHERIFPTSAFRKKDF